MAAYRRVYDLVTCRLTVKKRNQFGTLRSVMEYGLPFYSLIFAMCWQGCSGIMFVPYENNLISLFKA